MSTLGCWCWLCIGCVSLWLSPIECGSPNNKLTPIIDNMLSPNSSSNDNASSSPPPSHSIPKLDKEKPLGDAPHEPSFAQATSSIINTAASVNQTPTGTQRLSQQPSVKPSNSPKKYLIQSHTDLYQSDDLARLFFGAGGLLCAYLQLAVTALCVLGVVFLAPMMTTIKWVVMSVPW